jgi:hypothetical protein
VPKIGGAVVLSEHYFLLLEAVGNIQVQHTFECLLYVVYVVDVLCIYSILIVYVQ